jgi:hypothetical protein
MTRSVTVTCQVSCLHVSSLALLSAMVHTTSQGPAVLVSVVVSWLAVLWICG